MKINYFLCTWLINYLLQTCHSNHYTVASPFMPVSVKPLLSMKRIQIKYLIVFPPTKNKGWRFEISTTHEEEEEVYLTKSGNIYILQLQLKKKTVECIRELYYKLYLENKKNLHQNTTNIISSVKSKTCALNSVTAAQWTVTWLRQKVGQLTPIVSRWDWSCLCATYWQAETSREQRREKYYLLSSKQAVTYTSTFIQQQTYHSNSLGWQSEFNK